MDIRTQQEKAAAFRGLHDGSRILILPNAWDVASARIFEAAGFRAIGTTSCGVAWALGYPDGERMSREEMLGVVRRIASRVTLPVTADMEAGFARTPEGVAETARGVIAAGAVGINLEDGTHDPERPLTDVSLQVEMIRAARQAASSAGVPLVINARTDAVWSGSGEADARLDVAVRRANAYRAAGADCLFVFGVRDPQAIARLVREIDGPLNVIAGPGVPAIPALAQLGVARVSVGGGPMRATLTLLRRIADELRGPGAYTTFLQDTIPYSELNALLEAGL